MLPISKSFMTLNPLFCTRNAYFRKLLNSTAYFKQIFVLDFLSSALVISFPLIAQLYIHYIFPSYNFQVLLQTLAVLVVVIILKIVLDSYIRRRKIKAELDLETTLKLLLAKNYAKNVAKLTTKQKKYLSADVKMFGILVRTYYTFFMDILCLLFTIALIFFFNKSLLYSLFILIPVFVVLSWYMIRISKGRKYLDNTYDFELLLSENLENGALTEKGISNLTRNFTKSQQIRYLRRTQFSFFESFIRSFTLLYRVLYLSFFAHLFFEGSATLVGLIVGLLFITILMRPLLNQITEIKYWFICEKSYYRILSQYKQSSVGKK